MSLGTGFESLRPRSISPPSFLLTVQDERPQLLILPKHAFVPAFMDADPLEP